MLKLPLITKDSKPNSEEEEREKLITMPEKDWLFKTKINITLLNTDWLPESPVEKLLLKLFMPPLKEIELFVKLTLLNWKNGDYPLD